MLTLLSCTIRPTLSYQRLQTGVVLSDEEILAQIRKCVPSVVLRLTAEIDRHTNTRDDHRTVLNKHDAQVLESFITFNKAILKTNFFTPTKVAVSFRLDPSFLPASEYPIPAYGLFLVVGNDFRGFHLRFKDVARGGIRIVSSRNREAYSSASLFLSLYIPSTELTTTQ